MRKVRVLIFLDSFRLGGSERQAVELIKRLDRSSMEPLVACFDREGPLAEELPGYLDDIHAFPLKGFFNATAVRQAGRFLRLLKQSRVHVVQCFDFYSNVFAIPLARLAGVPIILGSQRTQSRALRTRMQHRAERWTFGLATGIVANSQTIKDQMVRQEGIQAKRIWVIHNGLALERFNSQNRRSYQSPVPNNHGVRIAVVANLRPEKGHLVFLDAVYILAKIHPDATFMIVGDGSMQEIIVRRVKELGLTEKLEMTGEVKDIPAFLRCIDIVVNPSRAESFPNAVMEAMAASLPVVATDVGGTNELVAEGVTGYLVPPGDGVAMAERLARLCNDPDTRLKMGEAGRRRIVEQFTADRMARKFENLFRSLLQIEA